MDSDGLLPLFFYNEALTEKVSAQHLITEANPNTTRIRTYQA
jgi:hypothetical protein